MRTQKFFNFVDVLNVGRGMTQIQRHNKFILRYKGRVLAEFFIKMSVIWSI